VQFLTPKPGVSVNKVPTFGDDTARRGQDLSHSLGLANFGLAKQRLAVEQSAPKGQYDAERGLLIDPRTGQAMPVTQGGVPIGPKGGAIGGKVADAKDVLTLLNEVDELLPKSTGSYTGAGIDAAVGGVFGSSTAGARAGSQLKALQGALIGKMPKMTGPQSDKDVQLYREMAGQVGDVTIPVSQRQAASAIIRKLNEKYAGMPEGSSRPPTAAAPFADSSKEQRYQAWKASQGR
jgi:hypothetical protein